MSPFPVSRHSFRPSLSIIPSAPAHSKVTGASGRRKKKKPSDARYHFNRRQLTKPRRPLNSRGKYPSANRARLRFEEEKKRDAARSAGKNRRDGRHESDRRERAARGMEIRPVARSCLSSSPGCPGVTSGIGQSDLKLPLSTLSSVPPLPVPPPSLLPPPMVTVARGYNRGEGIATFPPVAGLFTLFSVSLRGSHRFPLLCLARTELNAND